MQIDTAAQKKSMLPSASDKRDAPSPRSATVALATGDGIGPEIVASVTKILAAAGAPIEWLAIDIGREAYARGHNTGISHHACKVVEDCGVVLKGPTTALGSNEDRTTKEVERRLWSTFANKRVFRTLPGVPTHYSRAGLNIDLTVIQDNVEGTHTGIEHMLTHDVAVARRLVTRPGSLQLHRYAFEVARRKRATRITCGHKASVMRLTDGVFLDAFYEVAADYPDIVADDINIDELARRLVVDPTQFEIIVLPNLLGDVICDLCTGLVGGLGFSPSADVGSHIAVFGTAHGPAPELCGRGVANPTALLLSATMMLRHIGFVGYAHAIEAALLRTLASGARTHDFGDSRHAPLSTEQYVNAIIANLVDTAGFAARQEPWTIPSAPVRVVNRVLQTPKPSTQRAVGMDIFVETKLSPERLASAFQRVLPEGVSLTMISNRGVEVWPKCSAFTECVNQYRLRIESWATHIADEEGLLAIAMLVSRFIRVCSVEMLLELDGERCFSGV